MHVNPALTLRYWCALSEFHRLLVHPGSGNHRPLWTWTWYGNLHGSCQQCCIAPWTWGWDCPSLSFIFGAVMPLQISWTLSGHFTFLLTWYPLMQFIGIIPNGSYEKSFLTQAGDHRGAHPWGITLWVLNEVIAPEGGGRILNYVFQLMFFNWIQDLRSRTQATECSPLLMGRQGGWYERNWGMRVIYPVNKKVHAHLYTNTCLALPAGPAASTCRISYNLADTAVMLASIFTLILLQLPLLISCSGNTGCVSRMKPGCTRMEMWWLLGFSQLIMQQWKEGTLNLQQRKIKYSKWLHFCFSFPV